MITGTHLILYSTNADADRAFLRGTLGFPHVDAGHGWLIFALPPAEAAIHPAETAGRHELYLMCDAPSQNSASPAAPKSASINPNTKPSCKPRPHPTPICPPVV